MHQLTSQAIESFVLKKISNELQAPLMREMLAKMGRNLLRFQLIETGLKLMLPFTHQEGSASGYDAYLALKEDVKTKTLGGLRTMFLEAMKTEDPDRISEYLNEVIESRNNFIHHFLQQPGISLNSNDGCHAAISYLDHQFDLVEMLFDVVSQLNIGVSRVLGIEYPGAELLPKSDQ